MCAMIPGVPVFVLSHNKC